MLETYQVNDYNTSNYTTLNDSLVYLDYINNTYKFKNVTINPSIAYRYQGNMIGLFRELNIDPSLYLFTMYINGYTSPIEYKGDIYTLKLAIKPPIPSS